MTTTTAAAIDRLRDVHPHHVERIFANVVVDGVGVVSTVRESAKVYGGFYTGVVPGSRVVTVEAGPGVRPLVRLASPEAGASVALDDDALVALPLADYTAEDVEEAKRAVDRHADRLLEIARNSAVNGRDAAALAALRASAEAASLSFALNVWRSFFRA